MSFFPRELDFMARFCASFDLVAIQEIQDELSGLIARLRSGQRMVPNFLLLGDLNLDCHRPRADRRRIDDRIRGLNARHFGDGDERRVYFPFLDRHPRQRRFLRTNARASRTYDHIGFFRGADEERLPNDRWLDHLPIWVRIPRPGFSL